MDLIPTDSPTILRYRSAKLLSTSGAILLIRLGDFYEAFDDDARRLSETCEIALTRRKDIPMAGIPVHAANRYYEMAENAGVALEVCE